MQGRYNPDSAGNNCVIERRQKSQVTEKIEPIETKQEYFSELNAI